MRDLLEKAAIRGDLPLESDSDVYERIRSRNQQIHAKRPPDHEGKARLGNGRRGDQRSGEQVGQRGDGQNGPRLRGLRMALEDRGRLNEISLMLLERDPAFFGEPNNRPLLGWKNWPVNSAHSKRKIEQSPQKYVCGHRSALQNFRR